MATEVVQRQPARTVQARLARLMGYGTVTGAREALWGYMFATPWLAGLVIFVAGPILASLFLSLTKYDIIRAPHFIGIANYRQAFFGDRLFWGSLRRTFTYAMVAVPVGISGSLLLALMLNQRLPGTNLFRTMYFMPHLTPAVAMALLWMWMFHPEVGPINYLLSKVGIKGPGWFASTTWALPAIIIINMWAYLGSNHMLIFLAGLQGVPQEMYEAAEIDGAGRWARFRHVTLPMISPTVFFNLIMGIIGALKVFTIAYVATSGGPSWATWFYALHIYRNAFEYFQMGYGAALAWIFAVVLMTFTLVQVKLSGRWVYYAGGGA